MDLIKRHLWLVITFGAMVVLSAGAIVLMIMFQQRAEARMNVLEKSQKLLSSGTTNFYNDDAAEILSKSAEYREKKLQEIEGYIKGLKWEPLIPRIFTKNRTDTDIYTFKTQYREELPRMAERIGGVILTPESSPIDPRVQAASVYVAQNAFHQAAWISEGMLPPEADRGRLLSQSQDDLWLMEDLLAAVKRTNDAWFQLANVPERERTVANAVVKEVHKMEIGAQFLPTGRSGGRGGRYLYVGNAPQQPGFGGPFAPATPQPEVNLEAEALTLSGRASDNNEGRYLVLPWKMTVVADAGNFNELIRQLSGTRSFLTVLNVKYEMVPDTEEGSKRLLRPLPASRISEYGPRPLVRLTIWGESLVFRMEGARPTTPEKPAENQG